MRVRLTKRQLTLLDLAAYRMMNAGYDMINHACMKGSPVKMEDVPKLEADLEELKEIRLILRERLLVQIEEDE